MHDFYERFIEQMAYLLHDIGVPVAQIREEMEQMRACQVGPTQSMSKVTSMNYMMWRLEQQLYDKKFKSREQVALRLSEFPLKSIGYRYRRDVGVELFQQAIQLAPQLLSLSRDNVQPFICEPTTTEKRACRPRRTTMMNPKPSPMP